MPQYYFYNEVYYVIQYDYAYIVHYFKSIIHHAVINIIIEYKINEYNIYFMTRVFSLNLIFIVLEKRNII